MANIITITTGGSTTVLTVPTVQNNITISKAVSGQVNVQSDWTETDINSDAFIQNKPVLSTVATSGSYNDLSSKPFIPSEVNDLSDVQLDSANLSSPNGGNAMLVWDTQANSGSGGVVLFEDSSYNTGKSFPPGVTNTNLIDESFSEIDISKIGVDSFNNGLSINSNTSYASTGTKLYVNGGARFDGVIKVGDNASSGYDLPATDGTANQFLKTDGSGAVSFSTPTTSEVSEGSNLYYTEARVSSNADVAANTAKVSFPGFGTTAGTALEGNTALFDGQYSSLSGVPSTFTPSSHTHTASEITDFDTEVSNNTDVVANTAKVSYPTADSTKVAFISVTQAVDLDTMESDIATNNAKVSYTDAAVDARIGAASISDLSDVPTIGTAGQVLVVNAGATALEYANQTGGGASAIDDLTDVDTSTTAPSTNDTLVWNGTNWVPGTVSSSQWTTSGSDIYYTTGNVGIGTATPSEALDVSGNAKVSGSVTFGAAGYAADSVSNSGILISRFGIGTSFANAGIAIGNSVGRFNSGLNNVAVGPSAGYRGSYSVGQIAIGEHSNSGASAYVKTLSIGVGSNSNYNGGVYTTSVGANTGSNSPSSYTNSAFFGYQAGHSGGNNSVFVGYEAGKSDGVQLVNDTVAVGYQALTALTTGTGNTAVGYQAGSTLTSNSNNTLFGYQVIAGGSDNTAFGYQAMNSTSGDTRKNVAVGSLAGIRSGASVGNILLGYQAGKDGSGENNFFAGDIAGASATGNRNIGIGGQTGRLSTGSDNVWLGQSVGYNAAVSYSVAVGSSSQEASNSVVVGYNAGNSSSASSVFIGYQAGAPETNSNRLYIENSNSATPLIYGEFDNDILRINGTLQVNDPSSTGYAFPTATGTLGQVLEVDASGDLVFATPSGGSSQWTTTGSDIYYTTGNVGIGTATPSQPLDVVGDVEITGDLKLTSGTGSVVIGSTAGAGAGTSSVVIGDDAGAGANVTYGVIIGRNAVSNVGINGGSNSVTIGWRAGQFAGTTAGSNVFVGPQAGQRNTGSNSTVVGRNAGINTTGSNNVTIGRSAAQGVQGTSTYENTVAVGYQALTALTTGAGNTAVGYQASDAMTVSAYTTALGYQALSSVNATDAAADGSTAVGYLALTALTTGGGNTAMGSESAKATTDGIRNTFLGFQTQRIANASYNTGVGFKVMYDTSGNHNTAMGYNAFNAAGGKSHGVAIGSNAAASATNPTGVVAIGSSALTALTTGAQNTAVGYQAGLATVTNTNGTFLGYQAGLSTTGSSNTLIGNLAGSNITTGLNHTVVGDGAGAGLTTTIDSVAIGKNAMSSANSERAVAIGFSAGNTSGERGVHIGHSAGLNNSGTFCVNIGASSGNVTTTNSSVSIGRSSNFNVGGTISNAVAIGTSSTSRSNTVTIGDSAGNNTSTSSVFIGNAAGSQETNSNRLYIENSNSTTPLIYGEFDNDLIRINGDLEVKGYADVELGASETFTVHDGTHDLFQVDTSTSGTLFSVNDVSGLPKLEVDDTEGVIAKSIKVDDGALTTAGQYGKGAEIWYQGTSTPTAGSVYYLNSSGDWSNTDASAAATAKGMLSVSVGTDSDVDGMVIKGFVYVGTDPGGSVGDVVYLSETANQLTTTAPTTASAVVRVCGYKVGTNIVYFDPSKDWIELS